MKTFLSFACLLVLTSLSTPIVRADIAKPKTPEQQSKVVLNRQLEIVPDAKVWQARLQISQSDFQELRAAVNGATGSNTSIAANIAHSSTRTIIAGVLLFLSVSFGGVWIARRSSATRARKAIAASIVVFAVLGVAAIITRGNAGPPPGYLNWRDLPKNFSQGRSTSGSLAIEVVPDNPNSPPGIKLLLPKKPKESGDE
jgi:hypothetical protein